MNNEPSFICLLVFYTPFVFISICGVYIWSPGKYPHVMNGIDV